MKLEDLKEDVQRYTDVIKDIERKRALWNSETKAFIIQVMTKVKDEYDLDWSVFVLESAKNMEGVNLTLGNSYNSVYTQNEDGSKYYSKTGGNLIFSQAYNGDVFVLVLYPSIIEIASIEETEKVLGKIDPAKIDEELIIQKVSEFLDEMADWESSKSSHAVGFKS